MLKSLVERVLRDRHVQKEAVEFGQRFIGDPRVTQSVAALLTKAIEADPLVRSSQQGGQKLAQQILTDPAVEAEAIRLVLRILQDEEVQQEVLLLLRNVFSSKEAIGTTADLLAGGFLDPKVQLAIAETLKRSSADVLRDKETTEKAKLFLGGLIKSYFWKE